MNSIRTAVRNNGILGVLLIFLVVISGCTQVDRIVIDGATAARMENHVNEQLYDSEYILRGNTCSNMRNGGYVLIERDMLYFIHDMPFPDGSSLHYLQELKLSQIGSLTARNEIIGTVHGVILGKYDRFLLYIDHDNDRRVTAFDLENYSSHTLSEREVSSALLFDRSLYMSDQESGTLSELILGITIHNELVFSSRTISEHAGTLVGITDGHAFIHDHVGNAVTRIDLESGSVVNRIVGDNYSAIQVSGSQILYKDGDRLMRQPVTGGAPTRASTRNVAEYAVCGHWLAFTDVEGGIFVSHLDGSGIAQISSDNASGLQLVDNRVFYRNHHDDQALYTIDLIEGVRSAIMGEAITDGGVQIERIIGSEERLFSEAFKETVAELHGERTTQEQYRGPSREHVLFAEVSHGEDEISFYRRIGTQFSVGEVDALVVIGYKEQLLGRYTDGGLAYRVDTVLTLFDPVEQTPLISWTVPGRPPSEIKSGEGDRYGLPISWHQSALDLMRVGLQK